MECQECGQWRAMLEQGEPQSHVVSEGEALPYTILEQPG